MARLLDVKGDTTFEFTVPWLYPYDWLSQFGGNCGTVLIKLYDPIASVDTTTDPVIDLVVWTAAGPDCQFSQIQIPTQDLFGYPTEPVRQSDVQEAFKSEFPSFLNNCTYLVDNHYTTSEHTEYVTDVFKRYVDYIPPPGMSGQFSVVYSPAPTSVQATLLSAFKFRRGGTSFKIFFPVTPSSTAGPPIKAQGSGTCAVQLGASVGDVPLASLSAQGNSMFVQRSSEDQIEFSVPFNWSLPYYVQGKYTPAVADTLFDGTSISYMDYNMWASIYTTNPQSSQQYTCARDDFVVGMLQPPTPLSIPFPKGGKKKAHKYGYSAQEWKSFSKPLARDSLNDQFFVASGKQTKNPAKP